MENQPVPDGKESLIARAKAIIMSPSTEWPVIAAEAGDFMKVFVGYAVPLAAIGPAAQFIGMQLFGVPVLFGTMRLGTGTLLATAISSYVLSLVAVFVLAWVANFLAPKFEGKSDWNRAFKLSAYAMTATWIAGIFGVIPALSVLSILGLYSIYLFYKGVTPMMSVPAEKAIGFTAVSIIATIVVSLVVSAIAGIITGAGALAGGALSAAADSSQTAIDLGDYGTVNVDEENQVVDMGELGRIEIDEDGNTARVTIGGREVEINAPQEDE